MNAQLEALAAKAVKAGDDRLEARITRADHAAVMAEIDAELAAMKATWDDLAQILGY